LLTGIEQMPAQAGGSGVPYLPLRTALSGLRIQVQIRRPRPAAGRIVRTGYRAALAVRAARM